LASFPLTVEKEVIDSSLDATVGNDVAVGEIVTYRVRVNVTEGTSRGFDISDILPAGQRFIVGSAVVTPWRSRLDNDSWLSDR
jgi:uncharacterized repeat protein (TIGR01451 family)